MWLLTLWLWLCPVQANDLGLEIPTARVGDARVEAALVAWMDGLLSDPEAYKQQVKHEAFAFPEGSLFPYVFPAMTWTNLASRDPSLRPQAQAHIATTIELMLPAVQTAAQAPDLTKLTDYRSQAVMLGQLNLAIGCFKIVGGDGRYDAMHRRISAVLAQAMRERDGKPLDSYSGLVWPFDTIPVALSLHLADPVRYAPEIDAHLAWIDTHGTDPQTNLPYSRLDPNELRPVAGPRGCDLSYRIALLAQLDPVRATDLYERYTKRFWIRRTLAAGFAEWPDGASDHADIDSGPVVMGLGTAATGLGIAATRAAGDGQRWQTLERELNLVQGVLRTFAPAVQQHPSFRSIPLDVERYTTGFFFGDVCLLWATTWEPWGLARD